MGRATSYRLLLRLRRDHELQRLLAESGGRRRLRRAERNQLALRLRSVFGLFQELHERRDSLDSEVWTETSRTLTWLVLTPCVADWWQSQSAAFGPEFREAVEAIRLRSVPARFLAGA